MLSLKPMTHQCWKLPFSLVGTKDQRRLLLDDSSVILLVVLRAKKALSKEIMASKFNYKASLVINCVRKGTRNMCVCVHYMHSILM